MEYKLIDAEHYECVIEHLRKNFFADEPLNRAAGLCLHGCGNAELEQHSLDTLKDQLSIMAIDGRESSNTYGQIAGVILNGVLHAGDTEQALDKLQLSNDINYKKIMELLYKHSLKVDLFAHFKVDRIFDLRILSVDGRFRGHGLARELVRHGEQLARKHCFQLMKADATGIFSQKIFSSQGFVPVSEQLYAKYLDGAGQIILPVESPHIKLQLLAKKLKYDDKHLESQLEKPQ